MAEETIDAYLHLNKSVKISAKKVTDSGKYELFTEETIFDKLSSEELRQINNALIKVSKQYNELFDIYGLYDKRKDNKLKVILLSGKYKRIKRFNGFVYRAGNKDEDRNIIYINAENIIKNNKDNGIFKEMLKNSDISLNNAIKKAGNKAGIKGGFKDIIKHWGKERYGADDKTAENFLEDFKLCRRYRSW